ncbi:MAG TPA: DUF357 domain-containing protein [Candidatus Woesearchaeota archaeon]|nr:DUF357 domain-containing protein [Candidatus Woesearchaeota archaeon]
MRRMEEVFAEIRVTDNKGKEFYDFARNYFNDGQYFFEKEQFVEAFEAFVISWAYLDIGLKLGYFKTALKKYFTIDS